jgi:hypothetical protein
MHLPDVSYVVFATAMISLLRAVAPYLEGLLKKIKFPISALRKTHLFLKKISCGISGPDYYSVAAV